MFNPATFTLTIPMFNLYLTVKFCYIILRSLICHTHSCLPNLMLTAMFNPLMLYATVSNLSLLMLNPIMFGAYRHRNGF